uniref:SFRICE_017727 n=1 Tax=Spodoptera frugiperda TaxID=7108 RepID=A0A2H1V4H4_SPOFR
MPLVFQVSMGGGDCLPSGDLIKTLSYVENNFNISSADSSKLSLKRLFLMYSVSGRSDAATSAMKELVELFSKENHSMTEY